MPKVLAQSNLPNNAAVVVSSETIILRDPNNSILEKYTSDEQKQLSLKSYGIKPATLLSPGENKTKPDDDSLIFHKWLQNIGNAYIDTGIIPFASYKFEFSAISTGDSIAYIYGARVLIDPTALTFKNFSGRLNLDNHNLPFFRLYWKDQGSGYLDINNTSNEFINIVVDRGYVFANGESKGIIPDYSEDVVINSPIFLFAFSDESVPNFRGSVKIAYFKIFDENGIILRDLVPATRGEEIGMYDKVSRTLFQNKNDVGNFVAGDVENTTLGSIPFGFGIVNTPTVIDNEIVAE